MRTYYVAKINPSYIDKYGIIHPFPYGSAVFSRKPEFYYKTVKADSILEAEKKAKAFYRGRGWKRYLQEGFVG